MKGLTSFLSGLILGVLTGATLAILVAPESGEDLRGQIRQRVETIQSEVSRAAQERRAELEAQFAHSKQIPLNS